MSQSESQKPIRVGNPNLPWTCVRAYARCAYNALRHMARPGFRLMTTGRMKKYKTSDTLFVLGGGPSILAMTKSHWAEVARADSLGLNSWLIHDFVPTFYTTEESHKHEAFIHNLGVKADQYRDVPFIFKEMPLVKRPVPAMARLRNKFVSVEYGIKGWGAEPFAKMLRGLGASGFLDLPFVSPTKSASVDWSLFFARRLGYKTVVLCGVDLGVKYFYELAAEEYLAKGLRIPDSGMAGRTVHTTMDPARCSLVISEVIRIMRRELLDEAGVSVMVGTAASGLYPDVPVYPWRVGPLS